VQYLQAAEKQLRKWPGQGTHFGAMNATAS
jgi:hypothetical protein